MAERPGDRAMEVRDHRRALQMILDDVSVDVAEMDGAEFNGRNVAKFMGQTLAMVASVARVLDGVLVQEQRRIDLLAPPPGEAE